MNLHDPISPAGDADTDPWWAELTRGNVGVCRCARCDRWMHPPLARCPTCGDTTAVEPVDGHGRLVSLAVTHHPMVPGYLDSLPYAVALVELDPPISVRLAGLVLGDHTSWTVGHPVVLGVATRGTAAQPVLVVNSADDDRGLEILGA